MDPLTADDPRQVGVFRLHARLGAGGMGRVYLGYSPGGRAVAVKIVHPELARDPEFVKRFRHEVQAAEAVSGAYTAPVVGTGPDDSPPWLATAFVAGPSLADIVDRAGPLPAAAVWRLAGGLIEALQAIHGRSLVHRDLKPANILIAVDGPRVIDFGISRALESTVLTATRTTMGTPAYMSPEQAEGGEIGPPSDVFSLGSVIAFAATGTAPFDGDTVFSTAYRVVHAEPDLSRLPPALHGLVAGCLAKDPAARPSLAQLMDTVVAAAGVLWEEVPGKFWPDPVEVLAAGYGSAMAHPVTAAGTIPGDADAAAAAGVYGADVTHTVHPVYPPATPVPPAGPGPGTVSPRRTRRWVFAAGAAAAAAAAALGLVLGGRPAEQAHLPGPTAPAGQSTAAGSTAATPATPTQTVAATAKPASSLATIGQPVRADVFTFTVTKFECGLKILGQPGNGSAGNGPGGLSVPLHGQFCVAVVSERNDSSQPQSAPFDAQMTGTNGNTYEFDSDPIVLTNGQFEFLGSNYRVQSQINPGTTNMDVFPWDVPADVRGASVSIDSSTGTGSGTVNVRS